MTREEFYKTDQNERAYYLTTTDEYVMLPLTNDGFEALLQRAASDFKLPVIDDRLRSLLAGYIHHIPSDEIVMDFQKMGRALYKSFSNSMTYELDQQAKQRALDESKQKGENLNVTPLKSV